MKTKPNRVSYLKEGWYEARLRGNRVRIKLEFNGVVKILGAASVVVGHVFDPKKLNFPDQVNLPSQNKGSFLWTCISRYTENIYINPDLSVWKNCKIPDGWESFPPALKLSVVTHAGKRKLVAYAQGTSPENQELVEVAIG